MELVGVNDVGSKPPDDRPQSGQLAEESRHASAKFAPRSVGNDLAGAVSPTKFLGQGSFPRANDQRLVGLGECAQEGQKRAPRAQQTDTWGKEKNASLQR